MLSELNVVGDLRGGSGEKCILLSYLNLISATSADSSSYMLNFAGTDSFLALFKTESA